MDHPQRTQQLERLEHGYTAGFRALETVSLLAALGCSLRLAWKLIPTNLTSVGLLLLALILSLLAVDFLSGIAHWAGDTWGNLSTPIFGDSFIRSFREHHVNPRAITQHDFIQANGATAFVTLPILLPLQWVHLPGSPLIFFCVAFLFLDCVFGILSNQAHLWAHTLHTPTFVTRLQHWHLLISPQHHAVHHVQPHMKYYCIFLGWMNPFLTSINFFRHLEKVITALTGAIPRKDDLEQIRMFQEGLITDSR